MRQQLFEPDFGLGNDLSAHVLMTDKFRLPI